MSRLEAVIPAVAALSDQEAAALIDAIAADRGWHSPDGAGLNCAYADCLEKAYAAEPFLLLD